MADLPELEGQRMFHTYNDAELLLPIGLAPYGVRAWTWIELSISIPIFLAAFQCRVNEENKEDWQIVRNLWFTNVSQVIDVASHTEIGTQLIGLNLLSPGHVNDSGAFKLDPLHQIWRHREERNSFLYVLKDGRRLCYSNAGLEFERDKLDLMLSV